MTVRLIGIGNDLRGDDGAGLEVARRVHAARPDLDVRCCSGDAGTLLQAWDGASEILLVDAGRSGAVPGAIHRLTPAEVARARTARGTHDAGLADAFALAGALGRPLPRCTVVVIEGRSFRLGDPLSPEVARAVDTVVHLLAVGDPLPSAGPASPLRPD